MSGSSCLDREKILKFYRDRLPFSTEGCTTKVVDVYIKEGINPMLVAVTDTGAMAEVPLGILALIVD